MTDESIVEPHDRALAHPAADRTSGDGSMHARDEDRDPVVAEVVAMLRAAAGEHERAGRRRLARQHRTRASELADRAA